MDKRAAMEQVSGGSYERYFSPEKLHAMKQVFDAVCEKSAIPAHAAMLRDVLAKQIFDADNAGFEKEALFDSAQEIVAAYRDGI
jgi:hypothetical protein